MTTQAPKAPQASAYKPTDFASDQDVRWCPGCGDYSILATVKLVLFMEEHWRISFAPHEVDRENLDTLDLIAALLSSKVAA